MKLLIDSHILVWLLFESKRLDSSSRTLIESAEGVSVSMASLWELSIKYSNGKLKYTPERLQEGIVATGLETLPIQASHIIRFPEIRLPHGDPFDKLLIAQSETEGCSFLTADKQLLASKYRTVKA